MLLITGGSLLSCTGKVEEKSPNQPQANQSKHTQKPEPGESQVRSSLVSHKKGINGFDPESFCTYEFGGLDSYDYMRFPAFEELGIEAAAAKKLEETPYPDSHPPVLDKDGYQDGLKRVDKDGRLGVARKNGTYLLKPIYDYLDYPQCSPAKWILACIKGQWQDEKKGNGYNFYGKDGKTMPGGPFHNAQPFNEGLAAISNDDGKWGYIDESGKLVIPHKYDYARNFCQGYTAVSTQGYWGFIDKTGKEITGPVFDNVTSLKEGKAKVRYNRLWGILTIEKLDELRKKLD